MTRLIALLVILVVAVAIAVIVSRQHQVQSMPLVQVKASDCPRLQNPCEVIDCRKVRPGVIA